MSIDRLVDRLSGGLKPVRRRRATRDALVLLALGAVQLGLFAQFGGMRHDMPAAMGRPSFWWKLSSLGLIATVGGVVAVLSLDPARSPRRGLRWVAALAGACLLAGWGLDAARDGWPALAARVRWREGLECAGQMALLSLPLAAALGLLMRRGAPTDLGGTALGAGAAAAAWGAFVFVFACPYDDPLYVAIWYCVGCGAVTLLARLVLPPLARW